jgi:hypothetical protein
VIDETQVEETLRQLGDNADAVAASLRERGVKGLVGLAEHCPIATLLRRTYGADVDVIEVESDSIRVHCHGEGPYESMWIEPPPPAVRDFVERFDGGEYSDLVGWVCEPL